LPIFELLAIARVRLGKWSSFISVSGRQQELIVMELGFVEKVDEFGEDSPFISKVGGKPVWSDPGVPPAEQSCKKCGHPLVLLLQFHAPLSEGDEEDPRTLFLFMCRNPQCHCPQDSRCYHVLRYESRGLKVSNSVQDTDVSTRSHDTPSETENSESHQDEAPLTLCTVCGGRGTKACGGCRKVNYCSKQHQVHDWKLGHKRACVNSAQSPPTLDYDPSSGVVLPEWEVVTEPEPRGSGQGEERSEEDRMRDYEAYVKDLKGGAGGGAWSVEELEDMVGKKGGKGRGKEKEKDKVFKTFMKRIAVDRQQVSTIPDC
jgi:pre-rRNA-processing protein TSR4